jgi:hypothetical protein
MDSVPIAVQPPPSTSPSLAITVHVVRSTWIFHNISGDTEYPHGPGMVFLRLRIRLTEWWHFGNTSKVIPGDSLFAVRERERSE